MQRSFYLSIKLLEEAEALYDGRLLSLAGADLEEADDADDLEGYESDGADDGNDDCPYKKRCDNSEKRLGHKELYGLTDMELNVGAFLNAERSDDDADEAHQIREHRKYLVIRDILGIKFRSMIGGIISGLGSIILRLGLILRLSLILRLILLRLSAVHRRAAAYAEGSIVFKLSAAFGTYFHSSIPPFKI